MTETRRPLGPLGIFLAIAIFAIAIVFLVPIVRTPLIGDDAFNSYFSGLMGYRRIGLWQWYLQYTHDVTFSQGRYFPGMTLIQVVKFRLAHDATPIKIANLLAICLNLGTFVLLVRRIATTRIALFAGLLTITTFQARLFYESLTEVTIENQVVCELILLTFIMAISYANRPSIGRLVALTMLYAVSCATYEISYPFVAAYVGICFYRGGRLAGIRSLLALGTVFAAFVFMNIALRHIVPVASSSEFAITPNIPAIVITLFNQTISALPLTYVLANPDGVFGNRSVVFPPSAVAMAIGLATALTALVCLLRTPNEPVAADRPRTVWLAAASLFVLPAVFIAFSVRWQHEVRFGLPYQPAYIEGFGAALLLALAAVALMRRAPSFRFPIGGLAAIVAGAIVATTYQANAQIYGAEMPIWKYQGDALSDAERDGALGAIPEGSTVLLDTDYPLHASDVHAGIWAAGYQIFMLTGRRYDVWTRDDQPADPQMFCAVKMRGSLCSKARPDLYDFWVRGTGDATSEAVTMHVTAFEGTGPGHPTIQPLGTDALFFERSPAVAAGLTTPKPGIGYAWTPVVDERDYRLWAGHSTCGVASAPIPDADTDVRFVFGDGFYPAEGPPGKTWHWGVAHSRFDLVNTASRTAVADASITFDTYAPGRFTLWIRDASQRWTLPLSSTASTLRIRRILKPGEVDRFDLRTDGTRVAAGGDTRDLRLQAFNTIVDQECAPRR